MRSGPGLRRWFAAGAALLVALMAGAWGLLIMGSRGAEVSTVLTWPLVVLSLLVAVITAKLAVRADSHEDGRVVREVRRLAGVVRKQEANALARLVADTGDAQPAEVEFTQPDLMYWRTDGGSRRGSLSQIKSYYWKLKLGRLVVLGPAGSGKTVLSIQLVRDLTAAIVDNTADAGKRNSLVVPVRMSAAAFNPAAGSTDLTNMTGEQLSAQLDAWLVKHLVTVYKVAQKVAVTLVDQGWVLPVLDGLDEMDPLGEPPHRAAALLRAVNHATATGPRPVVLTCLTECYNLLTAGTGDDEDGKVVQDATVVGVEPLSASDVRNHLLRRFPDPAGSGRGDPRWRPVVRRLAANQVGDPLVATLRSPLRLFLAVTGYRNADSAPAELTHHTDAVELDGHLFAQLIPTLTAQQERNQRRYRADDVTRWLTTLARHLRTEKMAGRSGTELRLDKLWSAAGERAPRYWAAVVLTLACAGSLLLSMPAPLSRVEPTRDVSTFVGLFIGVGLVTFTAWSSCSRTTDLRRVDLRTLRTTTGRRTIAIGLMAGLAVAIVFMVAVRPAAGPSAGNAREMSGFGLCLGSARRGHVE